MNSIVYDCEATEYAIIPPKENTINIFAINEKCLVINFCDKDEKILMQSEISKSDAIELAKLILFKFNR